MKKKISKTRSIEQKVQRIYQSVSPSLYPKKEEKKNVKKFHFFMKNMFFNYLKIPLGFLEKKTMLEFGSGTGEYSLSYLLWGMKCDFVEANPISVKKFKFYCKKYAKGKNFKIYNLSLMNFRTKKKYDFVSSLGVIHHTDFKKAFKIKAKFLKKNGFMMLGIGNSAGMFQRNLQRFILYYLCDENKDKMYEYAKILFKPFLLRAQKHGKRTLDSIIYDNFINPKDHHPSINDLINLAKKTKLKLYSAWPPVMPVFLSNSAQSTPSKMENYVNVLFSNSIFNLIHKNEDDQKLHLVNKLVSKDIKKITDVLKIVNNIGDKKLPSINKIKNKLNYLKKKRIINLEFLNEINNVYSKSDFSILVKEISILLTKLKHKNIYFLKKFLDNTKVLFKGNSGLGMNYYIFYKSDD